MGQATGWTRVGRNSLPVLLLVLVGISFVGALLIAVPVAQLAALVLGSPQPFLVGWGGGVVVFLVLIAPLMVPRAARPLFIDPTRSKLRVGWRVAQASQVRHAYRLPDALFDERFQLRLSAPGVDPLVGISSAFPPEMSVEELDALIAMLASAPIEPDPAYLMRPPLGAELGSREAAQQFDDALARELMPFETTSYARPTLLAELERTRAAIAGAGVGAGTSVVRDLGLVAPGTTNAAWRQARLTAAQSETDPRRGFWALLGSLYRAALQHVESRLEIVGATHRDGRWWAGLAVVVFGFLAPWLSVGAVWYLIFFAYGGPGLPDLFGSVAFFVLVWPFIVWPGFMLMWRSRVARFERARSAALVARRNQRAIPDEVVAFFGPSYPEVSFQGPLLWLLIVESVVVLLAGGLTAMAMASGQVENWSGLALALPVGIVMVVASVPVFAEAVRVIRDAPARALRAHTLWRSLASPDPAARE